VPETTPLDSPLFSLKKPTQWLWRTNFTRDQVLQRLEEMTITKDWLICPLGEANKAVTIARRMWPGPGVKAWDWVWTSLFMANFVTLVVVAVQDLETRDVDPGPPGIAWLIGLAVFVSGWWLLTWSMVANPFFEKQVRIQTNHGHHVIESGPYAYIRHPGYVGFVAVLLATPLLLDSAWTFLPALIASALFVIRTALEDRMLQVELPGYREYAGRVRYRLIPGLW
jgi:protein-S-isoprenylcysteine O-methyltransferase Ste14